MGYSGRWVEMAGRLVLPVEFSVFGVFHCLASIETLCVCMLFYTGSPFSVVTASGDEVSKRGCSSERVA